MNAARTSTPRVVVAERDRDVRDVVAEVLEAQGVRAERVSNADDLIGVLGDGSCDALVVEAHLWHLGGPRLVEAIRRLQRRPAIVVMGDWPEASEPPANVRLIEKPFAAGALVAEVTAALSARSARGC